MNESETNQDASPELEERVTSVLSRPSDAQLRSAADRIRRLSDGVMDPDREAADLAPLAEEALRRTYRIIDLGVEFWMDLLRLNPGRPPIGRENGQNSGWLFGRALGATIRSWGDLKNARRGHLWFDSSPLLGPRMSEGADLGDPEAVPQILTESAADEITWLIAQKNPSDWGGEERGIPLDPTSSEAKKSRELFRLGLWSGALERELRNPQASSDRHLDQRTDAALAFVLERSRDQAPEGSNESEQQGRTRTLEERLEILKDAQGGQDRQWRPLFSFLRPGDVIVITLASDGGISMPGVEGKWAANWRNGIPLALAIVTARSNWDETGWWGRIGSVLFLDGPGVERVGDREKSADLQRLRTAFRFPDPEIENPGESKLALAFGLREPTAADETGIAETLRQVIPPLPLEMTTDDLALERLRLYRRWISEEKEKRARDHGDRLDPGANSHDEALMEAIPVGFAGPWRNASGEDLRATLGEFLDLRTETLEPFEKRDGVVGETGYQANLDIERFALTSENIRLGIFFDNPIRPGARASAQRIAPDGLHLPDPEKATSAGAAAPAGDRQSAREKQDGTPGPGKREAGHKEGATLAEGRRIDSANAHRRMFDLFKRGLPVEGEEEQATVARRARSRAASYLPAIRLDPGLTETQSTLEASRVFLLWKDRMEETSGQNSIQKFVEEIKGRLDGEGENDEGREPEVICAVFPRSEKGDLDRATFSRAFRSAGLEATDAEIPIDPAGTRIRSAVLISSLQSDARLLIVLTDDATAAVDLGAIIWLILAYWESGGAPGAAASRQEEGKTEPVTLETGHVLDLEANIKFRKQQMGFGGATDPTAEASRLQKRAWRLLSQCPQRVLRNPRERRRV